MLCVLYKPSRRKVLHEYSARAGGGNEEPKVTQLLDGRPGTQTPFSALSTSLSVSFPFTHSVVMIIIAFPVDWCQRRQHRTPGSGRRKRKSPASRLLDSGVPRGFLKALNAVYCTCGGVSSRQCGLVGSDEPFFYSP